MIYLSSVLKRCSLAAGLLATSLAIGDPATRIETARQPVVDSYHGTQVTDDYQWLEASGTEPVKEWSRKQNERTRAHLDQFTFREGLAQELQQLRSEESARFSGLSERQGRLLALRFKPPAQQPVLVRISSLEPPTLWRPVFDPNTYNPKGTTSIDWYVPSLNGRLVAVCLSENGSEQGALHFFDVDTGKELEDRIPRVQYPTAGGSAAWLPDNSGVLYTRYPHEGERPQADVNFYQQVWSHKLGTPASEDRLEIGKDFPRIAEIRLDSTPDGHWLLATVENGDGGDYAHYTRDPSGIWRQLTRFEDGIKAAEMGRDNALYLVSRQNAPRGKILRLPLSAEMRLASATEIVPQTKGVVQELAPADHGIYVSYLVGGPSELVFYPKGSTRAREIPTLPVSSIGGIQSWNGDDLVFGNTSYLQPFGWYSWKPGSDKPTRTALSMTSPVDFSDIEVVREFATSKDGTKVPLNILRKKGVLLDGGNPAILYGYGGYGINMTPGFDSTRRVWFEAGGVYVVANLRGGGEFGEEWHKQGNLTRKQNVFDDFIAAAGHLIKRGYTSSERLAVEGGSNGGLLMGAFLTQRPDLARAVVTKVGIYDMLRVELDPNGQFNVTEFGTVKDPDQFKALHAYSPYHRVKDGVKYPAVLLTTGENDGRVNPFQSRKMAARLQAATTSGHPVLYRSNASAGHGIGSSLKDRIAEQADVYSFLFSELGVNTWKWKFE
ncbi:MAG: prolyl oligopeptidase family serine peptidase [Verrucomicrobiota bacterium]